MRPSAILLLLLLTAPAVFCSSEIDALKAQVTELTKLVYALAANSTLLRGPGYLNVADAPFNAMGNGMADDTDAVQAALNAAGSIGGGVVFLPPGTYYIARTLVVPGYTTLKGSEEYPWRDWGVAGRPVGTTLLAVAGAGSASGTPFIQLTGQDSGVMNLAIFYPNQTETNPPVAYPPTIQGAGDDHTVKNVLLVNPYFGIDFATNPCGRHLIEAVYGQPLNVGIAIDKCYDIGRIKQIHFWPFWSSNPAVWAYQNANAVTLDFYRTDWEIVEDVFSFGYHIGIRCQSSANGAINGQFTDINFDNVDIGLDITDTQQWGIMFSNLNLANAGGGTNHIGIYGRTGGNAMVVVRGASFWGDIYAPLLWQNAGFMSISDSLVQPSSQTKDPAFGIYSGRAMMRGNYFEDKLSSGIAIYIGPDTDRVMATSNELVGNALVNEGTDTLVAINHA